MWMIGGAALGLAAAYIFEPGKGRQRRAFLSTRGSGLFSSVLGQIGRSYEGIAQRLFTGLKETAKDTVTHRIKDSTLMKRIQSKLERHLADPGQVNVSINDGVVSLAGKVIAKELDPLLESLNKVMGIVGIENHLEASDVTGEPKNQKQENPNYLQ